MKRAFFIIFLFLSSLSVTAISAQQSATAARPAIVTFTSDVTGISLEDAEAGHTTAALSWYIVGWTEGYALLIQAYALDA